MNSLTKGLALIVVVLLIGVGLVIWKNKVGAQAPVVENLSKEDMEMILEDQDPMMLRQIANDPKAKKEVAENVKEIFSIAAEAERAGLAADINVKRELEDMEISVMAINYDEKINKDTGSSLPALGMIGEDRINQFYEGEPPTFLDYFGFDKNSKAGREAMFQQWVDAKIGLMKMNGMNVPKEIPEDQLKQARDFVAKTRIYYKEAVDKINSSKGTDEEEEWAKFARKVDLQTKLQKAQFLGKLFQKKLAERVKVSKEDIDKYLEEHPELNKKEAAKIKADEILTKIKNGEDFAKLAAEFSEDPGSKDKGGLYEGIGEGEFVPEFEAVVFNMQPGQVADQPVESKFGYHIIKLEKLGEKPGADGQSTRTFDARHILISTLIKDPEDPSAREMPVEDFVRAKLEKEKAEKVLEEIKEHNPVAVAEDFEIKVPEMPEGPMMLPENMQMPPEDMEMPTDDAQKPEKPEPKKSQPKKK